MTNNKKDGGFYNTSPAISPQGDKIVFISDRDVYLNIYIMNVLDGKIIKRIVESGRTNDFEELNVLFPSLTWSPDNKKVALSVKSGGYDIIQIIDSEKDESEALPFELEGIESVSWSPDSNKIAFIGSNNKQSDVYIYYFDKKELVNITNDIFTETDITWMPDSKGVIFSSDRGEYTNKDLIPKDFEIYKHDFRQFDLYKMDLLSKQINRITDWKYSNEKSAVVSSDGLSIIFISDKNGIDNLYKKDIAKFDEGSTDYLNQTVFPITNSLSGINQLSLTKDTKKLVFTSLYNTGYNIYQLNNPFDFEKVADELVPTNFMKEYVEQKNNVKKDSLQTDSVFISTAKPVVYNKIEPVKQEKVDSLAVQEPEIFVGSLVEQKRFVDCFKR